MRFGEEPGGAVTIAHCAGHSHELFQPPADFARIFAWEAGLKDCKSLRESPDGDAQIVNPVGSGRSHGVIHLKR